MSNRMYKIRVIVSVAIIAAAALVIPSAASTNVSAAADSSVIEKSRLYAVYECYQNGSMIPSTSSSSWTGYWDSVVSYGGSNVGVFNDDGSSVSYKSCLDVFNNYYSNKLPAADANASVLAPFYRNLGYTASQSSSDGRCADFNFQHTNGDGTTSSVTMCATGLGSNETITDNTNITINYRTSDGDNMPQVVEFSLKGDKISLDCNIGYWLGNSGTGGCGSHSVTNKTFNDLAEELSTDIDTAIANNSGGIGGTSWWGNKKTWMRNGPVQYSSYGEANQTYTLGNASTAGGVAIRFLSGNAYRNRDSLKLQNSEKRSILESALNNYFGFTWYQGNENSACNISSEEAGRAQSAGYLALKISSSKTCYVIATNNKNGTVPGFNSAGYPDGTNMNFADVVTGLNGIVDAGGTSGGSINANPTTPGTTPGGNNGEEGENATTIEACYQAASSLGWFLCPVTKIVGWATTGLYEAVIQPFLGINAEIMQYGGNGTYHGWTQFRNFANILFAIAFAVVILAQVTGIGISNHNIKKILPRFVMVVILVNVSFILCQLAVDISNILGYSLNSLFTDMANNVNIPQGEGLFSLDKLIPFITGSLFTTGAVVGAAVIGISTWEVWLIPFLIGLLGCVIGVIFFFIILGVRQAGVVILVAVAPIAIVCYALPNTKSIFDRWKKMFTALILVYPICGALMGAGKYASALLLAAGGGDNSFFMFFYYLTAMLVSVAPFFMIPSLVKSSMMAMGNLGMKISQLGKGFSGTLGRAARNSDFGRDSQRRLEMRNAERTFNRIGRKSARIEAHNAKVAATGRGKMKALGRYDQLSQSRASMRYNRLAMEDVKAGSTEELLKPGSARWKSLTQRQQDEMISGRQQLYESGAESGVDINNLSTVADEYESQLDKLDAAIASGSKTDRDAALTNVKALQNILSKTDKGRGMVQDKVTKRLYENPDYATKDGDESALSLAAGHIMAEHADLYKKSNRGLHSMMQDLSGRQYSRGYTSVQQGQQPYRAILDGNGNPTGQYRSAFYDKMGTSKYNAQSLAGADEGAIARLRENVGSMNDTELADLTSTVDQIFSNPSVAGQLQPEVKRELQQIVSGGAARGAVGRSVNPSAATFGSSMMAQASTSSLDNMISRIRDGNAQTQMNANEVRNVAENARRALETDSGVNNPEVADRLQQILSAAKSRNVKDIEGNDFNPVDASAIYLNHGSAANSQAQSAPTQQQTQPQTPPIIQTEGDQSMERIREIARENPGPRQRGEQNNLGRQNGQGGNGNGPTIIVP